MRGTAAEIARNRRADLCAGWVRVVVQEHLGGEEPTRCAVSTLDGIVLDRRLLQRVKLAVVRESFHRGYALAVASYRKRHAAQNRFAVHDDSTRAARARIATFSRAHQPQLLAQQTQQRQIRFYEKIVCVTVYSETNLLLQTQAP